MTSVLKEVEEKAQREEERATRGARQRLESFSHEPWSAWSHQQLEGARKGLP